MGHRDAKASPWKKNVMVINSVVPVSGVPFITSTNSVKTVTIIKKTDTELIVDFETKTIEAPYSDSFTC